MKQSTFLSRVLRKPPSGEKSRNAQLLTQAAYIDKLMSGVYSYLPLGWRVLKKIENIIRNEMNAAGGQELFMPALHPIENYEKTKRDAIDVLFHLKSAAGKHIVLGQSHEEVIVPLAKRFIESYKDLPLYLYQIQSKFRNELRAKSGILRSREFIMKDLYSFHRDEEDFESYYTVMKNAYHNIFSAARIGEETFLTYASGGTFSKFSHEFQTITEAGEDMIHLCRECGIAVNNELLNTQKSCPSCGGNELLEKKAIEVGNIFPLKTKFSDAFGLEYTGEDGQKKQIIMGCYGIGLGRLMGAIVEIHNDENGIVWPKSVSPFQAHLVSLGDEKISKRADKIYDTLQKNDIDVLYDDRTESAGIKLKDADLIGIPVRLVISKKTGTKVEYKKRTNAQATLQTIEALIKTINKEYSEYI